MYNYRNFVIFKDKLHPFFDMVGVVGSNPIPPTILAPTNFRALYFLFFANFSLAIFNLSAYFKALKLLIVVVGVFGSFLVFSGAFAVFFGACMALLGIFAWGASAIR